MILSIYFLFLLAWSTIYNNDDLERLIFLSPPPECCDYEHTSLGSMPLCQHQVLCGAGDGIPVFVLARQAPHQVSHSSSSLYNMAEATRFQKWIVRAWGGKNKEEVWSCTRYQKVTWDLCNNDNVFCLWLVL